MVWARFDDGFWTHQKVLMAGNEAVGAFVRMVCYSCNQLTDGFVPMKVARFIAPPSVLRKLMDVGLLEAPANGQPEGYSVHDFLTYQPSRESVESEREKTKSRVAKHRENKVNVPQRNGVTPPVTNAVSNPVSNSAPSRPVPTHPDQRESDARAPEARCPTTEPATTSATDPAEVLASMRAASSGLVADPTTTSAGELVAVKRAVDALLSRGVALDVIVRGAAHLAHGHWTQRAKRSVITAGRLVEERDGRGSILGELLAELDGCEQCRPAAPKRTLSHPLRIVELPAISEAEAAGKRALLARALGGERVLA